MTLREVKPSVRLAQSDNGRGKNLGAVGSSPGVSRKTFLPNDGQSCAIRRGWFAQIDVVCSKEKLQMSDVTGYTGRLWQK